MSSSDVIRNAVVEFTDSRAAVGAKGRYTGQVVVYQNGYLELSAVNVLLPPHQIVRVVRDGDKSEGVLVDEDAEYWKSTGGV